MKLTVNVYESITGRIKLGKVGSDCGVNGYVATMKHLGTTTLDIQEPKKKVKKWYWVLSNGLGGEPFVSKHRMTEEYAKEQFTTIQKIDSTEIEVEE